MKKTVLSLFLTLTFTFAYSQLFISENSNIIDLKAKKAKITIDNFTYKGDFQIFTSKKDNKDFLIFSYFSRTIVFSTNKPLNEIINNKSIDEFDITDIKVIHSKEIKSIIREIKKRGVHNIQNFIIVFDGLDNITFKNQNSLINQQ
ncbi:hypothetical protein [Lutibacter sp. B1]|uniref:hypothetical protein n=1 Tax=Lutibacter sp. B1 TaxID=2725996 RepID=UPI0014572445|nr:hypothetical protein [Lutibacter sp. B1]NLP57444.1 hypothetical protein [Lutibacter sp. B1]